LTGKRRKSSQVISRQAAGYGEACDLWSCGVILYFLLCGRPPFAPPDDEPGRKKRKRNGVDLNELTARVLKGDYALDFGPWPRASAAVLDLVKGLMRVDARARLTAARALEHAWITRDGVAAEVPAPLGAAALTSLARYARATFFHKRVYNALAETLTMGELASLRKEFAALDVDGDGFVTCGDLTALLAHLELAGAPLRGAALEVEAIVEACDLEDDHRISYHAFVVASMHRCAYLREDRVDKMFHEFLDGVDAAGTETITAESLQSHGFDAEVVADVFAAAKVSPGRGIHRDDFERLLRLGSILGASLGAQSTQAKSLLGDSTDWAQLLGSPPPLGVAGGVDLASPAPPRAFFGEPVDAAAPAPAPAEDDDGGLRAHLAALRVSPTGARVLAPRTAQHKPRDDAPYYYRPKPVSLTAGHFALSVRLTQIRSCEEKIEAAVNAGAAPADVEALEKRYLEVIVLGRDDHRVEAIKLRAQGQMAAALDAFREAKHLDFILCHRADFVANRGPLPEKRVVAETLSQAHARLAAMSDP